MAGADAKVQRLHALLVDLPQDDRIVIFTEYRDTAVGLWRSLLHSQRVGLVHGSAAALGALTASRRVVVERFAPAATRARPPTACEQLGILIATDVLAEGMNLQDARVVISYDLPWNPIRLAQRIGRIDRLGSPHARIEAFAFLPDRHLDRALGLMRRIRRKLRAVRVVGGDAPWSIAARRPARALLDTLDDAADARANARARWELARTTSAVTHDRPPVFGTVRWSRAENAALVGLRLGRTTILVLCLPAGRVEVDTAACWRALEEAATQTGDEPADSTLAREAERAVRAARSALGRAGKTAGTAALDRTGLPAVAALLRRLRRSGLDDPDAADAAELAMARMADSGPNGAGKRQPVPGTVAVLLMRGATGPVTTAEIPPGNSESGR
jgi:superfamily II DNA/RNA helicase